MSWAVREARAGDLEQLVAFNAALARETEDKQLDLDVLRAGVARLLADPGRGRYRVAEAPRGGEIAGALMLTREWSDWRDGWFWWIQSVYVAPAHRGRGVYRALHESVLADARAAGDVRGVRLYVERDNAAARRTYERLGMQPSSYRLYEVTVGGAPAPAG